MEPAALSDRSLFFDESFAALSDNLKRAEDPSLRLDVRYRAYKDEPARFASEVLGVQIEPYQADILDALAEYPSVAIRSGHGVGKTAALAWAAIWFLVTRYPSKIPITAPTFQKQVKEILWGEIHYWMKRTAFPGQDIDLHRTEMAVIGYEDYWRAVGVSASIDANIEGFHSPNLLYVVDEAKGVRDDIFDAIQGALTTEAKMIVASTPGARLGYFYKVFTKLRTTWKTFHVPCLGSWEGGTVKKGGSPITERITEKWIETRRSEWGEASPIYQARVMGEFPDQGEDTLIPMRAIEAAEIRGFDSDTIDRDNRIARALGVDVARYGDDLTVFTVVDAFPVRGEEEKVFVRLVHVSHSSKESTVDSFSKAKEISGRYLCDLVTVDDTGVGGGVTDLLIEADVPTVPINFGSSPSDESAYVNLKAEIFWNLRLCFEYGFMSLQMDRDEEDPTELDRLLGQLSSMRYEIKPKGIRIVDPDERKGGATQGGPKRSPDHVHSLGLAFWGVYRHGQRAFASSEDDVTPEEEPSGRMFEHGEIRVWR